MSLHNEKHSPEPAMLPTVLEENRIIDIDRSAAFLGYSTAHLRRLYRTKKLPAPTKIGERKLGYTVKTLMALVAGRSSDQEVA